MTYANPEERAAVIIGLHGLADYLVSNPGAPAPAYLIIFAFPNGDWPEMCAEIDAVAALLGVPTRLTDGGHYVASRDFGPVSYQAVAIPPASAERE